MWKVTLCKLNNAKRYVYIDTPYLILNSDMQTALILAAQSGIDVRILVPHIPDKKYVFSITQSNYELLIKAGVRVYEFTPGFSLQWVWKVTLCKHSTFANRPEALKELLNAWENQKYIPRGCNNIQYVSDHEYYHLLTVPLIDNDPKFATMIKRAKKNGIESNSKNGSYDIYEYVADMLCEKKPNNKQQRLKNDIMNYIKWKGKWLYVFETNKMYEL